MSFETERIIHEDAPTPAQLHKLAKIGIGSAAMKLSLRSIPRAEGAHYFVDEMDLMDGLDFEPLQARRRIAMRIGVRPPADGNSKVWSLRYFDTYHVEPTPNDWKTMRSIYRFEWTRTRALLAERTLRIVGDQQSQLKTLDEYFDQGVSFRDDAAQILSVEEEMRAVSRGDCEEVIDAASDYFRLIDSVSSRAVQ